MRHQFTATAERDGDWWVIQCVEHPDALSQVKRLDRAVEVHREAISYVTGIPVDDIEIVVRPLGER